MARSGRGNNSNKLQSKGSRNDFIRSVSNRLRNNPTAFLRLTTYNDAKNWMRRTDGCIGKYVDNGSSFLEIMRKALQQAGGDRLTMAFSLLQADHPAQKAARAHDVSIMSIASSSRAELHPPVAAAAAEALPTVSVNDNKNDDRLEQSEPKLPPGHRIDVYYGKTQ
jgi:hypothetical protein